MIGIFLMCFRSLGPENSVIGTLSLSLSQHYEVLFHRSLIRVKSYPVKSYFSEVLAKESLVLGLNESLKHNEREKEISCVTPKLFVASPENKRCTVTER